MLALLGINQPLPGDSRRQPNRALLRSRIARAWQPIGKDHKARAGRLAEGYARVGESQQEPGDDWQHADRLAVG